MATNAVPSSASLKVALVHDALTVPGGAEKVLLELHRLFPEAPIYTSLYRPERFPELKGATVIPSTLNRFGFLRNRHQITFPLQPYAIEQFDLSGYDLVFSDSSACAKGVLTRPETLHICYCHTPMRWAWLPYLDERASSSFIRRISAHYLRIWDHASVDRVDMWLANSKTAAARIKKFYRRDAEVIYPPVEVNVSKRQTERGDFYLTVGRLVSSKRPDIIIEAAKQEGFPLTVVGDGPLLGALKKQASGHASITFLGRVSDEERDALYAKCRAFIFAAEEDAGIVPIEAMAFGKPVICYGRGGASETVIDQKTGVHFSEQSIDSLASAIDRFQSMSFDEAYIKEHAAQFKAERFRHEITEYIKKSLSDWPYHNRR